MVDSNSNTNNDNVTSISPPPPRVLDSMETPRKLNFDSPNFNVDSMT